MVLLTLIIAVLNLCLGYAAAVYLGYGPPSVWDAWEALCADGRGGAGVASSTAETSVPPDLSLETFNSQVFEEQIGSFLDEVEEEDMYEEPFGEEGGEEDDAQQDTGEMLDPDAPENWDLNEKFVETSVLKLNIAMMKSGARATEIDTQLRDIQGRSDPETIRRCLAGLKEDCQTYLADQTKAAEDFSNRIGELGELSAIGEEIEMTNLEQAAQIETTLSNLNTMDFESDLEAANARLTEEIKNLRIARHKLRDSQDVAFLTIAEYEGRLGKVEKQLYNDPLTNLYNRIGLEGTLHEWWESGRHRSRQMSAALFDLDQFGAVNDTQGMQTGDRILAEIAQLLAQQAGKGDLVARYAGQRFFIMMVDVGPRAATRNEEYFRQLLGNTIFLRRGQEITLTACGAATEVTPEDTPRTVFGRLEESLKLAKKAGPNQGYFHDGKTAEPIESPNLGAKPNEIRIYG